MFRKESGYFLIATAAHLLLAGVVYAVAPLADIRPEICNNQKDDDADGLLDCEDSECSTQPKAAISCRREICDNQQDDDGDGLLDCDDPDCSSPPVDDACLPPEPVVLKPEVIEPEPPKPEPTPEPTPPAPSDAPKLTAAAAPKAAATPAAPAPLVFGEAIEGGSENLSGMAVTEGNTYMTDSSAPRPTGPVQPLKGGIPSGTGVAETATKTGPVEASAVEITSPPQQIRCDESIAKDFPDAAKAAGVSGKVVVEILVSEQGEVKEAKVVKGLGFGLDELAIKRAKTCRFKPAMKGSTPVSFRVKSFPVVLLPE